MSHPDIRAVVVRHLTRVAPEVDASALKPDVPLRDQIDIDSMDFLNVVIAIHEELGVDIPEADYARLSTLDGTVAYLEGKLAAGEPRPVGS